VNLRTQETLPTSKHHREIKRPYSKRRIEAEDIGLLST
jgi:hypothetical protein